MTYWDLLEYIKTLKSGIGAIWKNHIFTTAPPIKSTNMIVDKSILLKVEDIIVFTIY